MRTIVSAALAAAGIGGGAHAASVDAEAMLRSFTVIALGDYELTSHTPGGVYVGGDVRALNGVSGGNVNATVGGATGTLIVGGDVLAGVSGQAQGDIAIGGANHAGSGLVAQSYNGNPGTVRTGVDVPAGEVESAMLGLSRSWSELSDTGGYSIGGDANNVVMSVSAPVSQGYAVVSMDGSYLTSLLHQNAQLKFQFAGGSPYTTIINVTGSSFNFAGKISEFTSGNKVVFNFHEATDITIPQNSVFGASIFAPKANIDALSGGADAFIVGRNIRQRYEVRKPFDGILPEPNVIPLPAAGWLLVAGLAGLGAIARRRSA